MGNPGGGVVGRRRAAGEPLPPRCGSGAEQTRHYQGPDRLVETGGQLQQQLADGAVTLASAWNGRVQKEIDSGTPVRIQWNQNLQTADYLVVPKGTANKEKAMELIAYCVSGQNNHRLSEFIPYAPINKESSSKVDPQVFS